MNETICGWFTEKINRMPENGDRFIFEGYVFTVEKVQAHRIERLKIKKIIEDSWSREKNHLMIEGEGGIGKTVTLLSLPDTFIPHRVPAVYIQLHELKGTNESETIEDYIRSEVFPGHEKLFQQFCNLANEPWSNGPRVILLMDGFNEIDPQWRIKIGSDINRWAMNRAGVQVITSSRYDVHTYIPLGDGYSRILLQPLEKKVIEKYLFESEVSIPQDENTWDIISHPLMLTLFVNTEKVLKLGNRSVLQDYRNSNTAGAIIWNYLQREIWRPYNSKT